MKLRNKTLITTVLMTAVFIALTVFSPIWHSVFWFGITTLLFALAALGLVYQRIIQRVEKLKEQLMAITADHVTSEQLNIKVNITGNDEISIIATQINKILLSAHHSIQLLQKQIDHHHDELKKMSAPSVDSTISSEPQLIPEITLSITQKDPLTHLPRRAFFNDALNKAISHAKRHQALLAVLIIDVDAFKDINRAFGRHFGDNVLNKISQRILETLRTEDSVAKLDGDEFIILLTDIRKPKFASVVAEKILQACARPMKEFFLTVSVGISIYPNDGESLQQLLDNADTALHRAKQLGGGKYQFYTSSMEIEAREFIQLGAALQQSINNKELVLYYQPKLNLKKGCITGVEALIRWEHPELGILNASQFIGIAEETGFIKKIGEWALREACLTNKFWQSEGYEHLTVSLNLSPKQFSDPDTGRLISEILKETELNPEYLELEINEATLMENIDTAIERLKNIHAAGIKLTIDHFGVGYTSISHLKQFPITTIKIDQSYIKGLPNHPNDSAITNAFISLAHNLGLEVIAEGVETAEQVEYLTVQQCDVIQGYFLSHPLPAQKIVAQFKKIMDRALF